jgi:hypothetical protein
MGTKIVDLVTLTLVFDLLIENFNLLAISFHVTRPFHGYKKIDLATLTLVFDLLIKNSNLGITV